MSYNSVFSADLFAGQTMIVTGGGSGIGRCIAHELAQLGANVVIIGRTVEKLKTVAAEIVEDGVTGLHFTPGDAEDLAAKVRWAVEHPEEMRQMGLNARRVYEEKYTPEVNYRQLMAIYEEAIAENRRSKISPPGRIKIGPL